VASSARLKDCLLGGKTNFPADRRLADAILVVDPFAATAAALARAFRVAVTMRVSAGGMGQFVDLGCGLPDPGWPRLPEFHHLATQPGSQDLRVVLVDVDPIVMVHARALLRGEPAGTVRHVEADLTETTAVLAALADFLDLRRPVALSLHDVLHTLGDDAAYLAVDAYKRALPSGSWLAISHQAPLADRVAAIRVRELHEDSGLTYFPRSAEQLGRFFDGWDLQAPGVAPLDHWLMNGGKPDPPETCAVYGAVALKP
jgi:hypothetical protein